MLAERPGRDVLTDYPVTNKFFEKTSRTTRILSNYIVTLKCQTIKTEPQRNNRANDRDNFSISNPEQGRKASSITSQTSPRMWHSQVGRPYQIQFERL